ncbi:uncharacterized protein [Drosophila takahashii]|uniref:uncharacterized protein n=1 Tax=Drosophila takahashii TaxID=29030 RepID=UPI001CF91F7B|nr:uncharacterized protein LOC108056227 [Drosophila takahashii]
MSLFRWRDSSLLHTLNFVRGIRSGANKVANNPRQRNRLRRQAEDRSCSRPRREQTIQNLENQEVTSYGQYMEKMTRLYEQQMKLEEDIAREEKQRLRMENERKDQEEIYIKTPLILCTEDVTGLRKLYIMDSEEHQNKVLMMYDDTRSFMDEHIEEAEDRFLLSEENVSHSPTNENENIVDLPEMEDDVDGLEQWNLDSSHGNWVRRVMEFLRFRRLS